LDEVKELAVAMLAMLSYSRFGDQLGEDAINQLAREYVFDEDEPTTQPVTAGWIFGVAARFHEHLCAAMNDPTVLPSNKTTSAARTSVTF